MKSKTSLRVMLLTLALYLVSLEATMSITSF